MSFSQALRKELRATLFFFLAFLGVGVVMDLFIRQTEVDWAQRLIVAAIAAGAFGVMRVVMMQKQTAREEEE